MELFTNLVILCLVFTPICATDCSTPNGFRSQCQPLNECAPLVSYFQIETYQTMPMQNKRYISMLLCITNDSNEESSYVCCPSNDTFFNTLITPQTTTESELTTTPLILTSTISDDLGLLDPTYSNCGRVGLVDRILGGHETGLGEYPWMALLEYENSVSRERSFLCSGSLIHKRFVLTAGHCLIGAIIIRNGDLVNVRLGEHNITSAIDCVTTTASEKQCADPVIDIGIKYKIVHPFYNVTDYGIQNDIGLIRLVRNIEMTLYIQPICFPSDDIYSPSGTPTVIAGWGRSKSELRSSVKQHVHIPIVNYEACLEALGDVVVVDELQICAGGEFGKDTCKGDSGGPLMINYGGKLYIEGVTSLSGSSECGAAGKPGVYTRVNAYHNWVLNIIEYEY